MLTCLGMHSGAALTVPAADFQTSSLWQLHLCGWAGSALTPSAPAVFVCADGVFWTEELFNLLFPASLCLSSAAAASLCCEGKSSSGAVTSKMLLFHFLAFSFSLSVLEREWLEQIQLIKYFTTVEKNPFLKPAFKLLKHGGSVHEQWLYICSPKGFFTQAVSGRWSSVSYVLKN